MRIQEISTSTFLPGSSCQLRLIWSDVSLTHIYPKRKLLDIDQFRWEIFPNFEGWRTEISLFSVVIFCLKVNSTFLFTSVNLLYLFKNFIIYKGILSRDLLLIQWVFQISHRFDSGSETDASMSQVFRFEEGEWANGLVGGPVYEEGVVQDVELVVHQTELESLVHLVRPALPGQSLLVPRFELMRDGQGWGGG